MHTLLIENPIFTSSSVAHLVDHQMQARKPSSTRRKRSPSADRIALDQRASRSRGRADAALVALVRRDADQLASRSSPAAPRRAAGRTRRAGTRGVLDRGRLGVVTTEADRRPRRKKSIVERSVPREVERSRDRRAAGARRAAAARAAPAWSRLSRCADRAQRISAAVRDRRLDRDLVEVEDPLLEVVRQRDALAGAHAQAGADSRRRGPASIRITRLPERAATVAMLATRKLLPMPPPLAAATAQTRATPLEVFATMSRRVRGLGSPRLVLSQLGVPVRRIQDRQEWTPLGVC